MAVASGQRTSGNVGSFQRKIDMSKEILLLEPDAAPLTVITKNSDRRPANDSLFSWTNDEAEPRHDAVNNGAGYNTAATTVAVDTGTAFAVDDIVKVPRTGELVLVSAISTNDLTIVRGIGGTTAAALVDNDPLLIVGTAWQEGHTSPSPRSENPVKVDNYTQIFRETFELSGSLLSSSNETSPHDWRHQQKKKGIEHKKDIEYAFLFGNPGTRTGANSKPQRTTGGLLHYLTQNNQDAGGTLTEAEVETFLRTGFRYGSQNKTLFVSPLVLSVLNTHAQGKLQTAVGAKTYGVQVMNWVSAHGSVNLVKHNLLEGATYGGYAVLVDFKSGGLAYRYLAGQGAPGSSRDTSLNENIQANDLDGRRDEYLTEAGFQVGLPKAHGVLTGVTS